MLFYHPYFDDAGVLGKLRAYFCFIDDSVRIDHCISIIVAALVYHIGDVYIHIGEHSRNVTENARYIFIEDADTRMAVARYEFAERAGRKVHLIFDVAVFKIIFKFLNRENCTVIFGLACGSSEMRDVCNVFMSDNLVVREVGNVF